MSTDRTPITDADGSEIGYIKPGRNAFGKPVFFGYWTLDPDRPPQVIKDRRWNREFGGVEDATRYMRAWAGEARAWAA